MPSSAFGYSGKNFAAFLLGPHPFPLSPGLFMAYSSLPGISSSSSIISGQILSPTIYRLLLAPEISACDKVHSDFSSMGYSNGSGRRLFVELGSKGARALPTAYFSFCSTAYLPATISFLWIPFLLALVFFSLV